MHRIIYIILSVLVVTSLLGGIRIGKKLQMIDTPTKTIERKILVTTVPQALIRYTLPCGFFFSVPNNISTRIASTSATVTLGKKTLDITCISTNAKTSSTSAIFTNSSKNVAVKVQGEKSLLNLIESGFDPRYVKNTR
ncbi:MAG: hypothetical protein NUV65_06360 [Candidatus Roizmanbacteria bacterium]|nr:hypothetical protein [Candidatus Roizmanbacteria bacterium]